MRMYVLLTLIGCISVTPSEFSAAEPSSAVSPVPRHPIVARVRATDARVRAAIVDGAARSASFRELLQRVEQLDVIVYAEMQQQLRGGRLAGSMRWVAKTRDFRYVRVAVNPEITGGLFIATLAHELQHVAEIGEAPQVTDEKTMAAFYRHVGEVSNVSADGWETEAARRAGAVVRRELNEAS